MDCSIRKAIPTEAELLTELTFISKRFWGYPEELMEKWIEELKITDEYIRTQQVYVATTQGEIIGYYSIVSEDGLYGLDNMFILPAYIGKGVGRLLFSHMLETAEGSGIKELLITGDPHARGFYEKMGATYLGEKPSSVIPGRTLPCFIYHIEEQIK